MKEKPELAKLGDRVRVSILQKLTKASEQTHIPRQQLADDALALYLNEEDAMIRERRRLALRALSRPPSTSQTCVIPSLYFQPA